MQTINTPSYVFDVDVFADRIANVRKSLNKIPLTFSIKANPFLIPYAKDLVDHLEVCSPGEMELCILHKVESEKIIYSGVNKGIDDITRAITYGVDIATCESIRQLELINQCCERVKITQRVIFRLSGDNQFGMSEDDILSIFDNKEKYKNVVFYGIHAYFGTQKSIKRIKKDTDYLKDFLDKLKEKYDYNPLLVEYGPGLITEYYNGACEESDMQAISELEPLISDFAKEYPLGLEFGRFLAASCGTYYTKVCDIKTSPHGNYVICDGGIHQLVYHGQNMAMRVPPVSLIRDVSESDEEIDYCLCGSLCTVADVLVRSVKLPRLEIGDVISFGKCGAYSVTEGVSLFLSREFPAVYLRSQENGLELLRGIQSTVTINARAEANRK